MTEEYASSINRLLFRRFINQSSPRTVDVELQLLNDAVEAFPKPDYQRTLASMHYRREEFSLAIETLELIPEKLAIDYSLLAMIHLQLGNIKQARQFEKLPRKIKDKKDDHLSDASKSIRKELKDMFDQRD